MFFSVVSLIFFIWTDTETDENLQMKFVNGRFHASSAAMCAMLKKADLESKGFQKEIITKEVEEEGTGESSFQASRVFVHVIKYLRLYFQGYPDWESSVLSDA